MVGRSQNKDPLNVARINLAIGMSCKNNSHFDSAVLHKLLQRFIQTCTCSTISVSGMRSNDCSGWIITRSCSDKPIFQFSGKFLTMVGVPRSSMSGSSWGHFFSFKGFFEGAFWIVFRFEQAQPLCSFLQTKSKEKNMIQGFISENVDQKKKLKLRILQVWPWFAFFRKYKKMTVWHKIIFYLFLKAMVNLKILSKVIELVLVFLSNLLPNYFGWDKKRNQGWRVLSLLLWKLQTDDCCCQGTMTLDGGL